MATPEQGRPEPRFAAILAGGMSRREFMRLIAGVAAWPLNIADRQLGANNRPRCCRDDTP